MATKKLADSSKPWIKSDEIMVDTSKTPWMDFEVRFKERTVLGYRWPTKINHYLMASPGVLV